MTDLLAPLRYSRDVDDVARAVARLMVGMRSGAFTEASRFRSVLALDGFVLVHPRGRNGEAECALVIHRDDFIRDLGAIQLSDVPIPRRNGWHNFAAAAETVAGIELMLHMPSGVEGPDGFRDDHPGQVKAYRAQIAALRQWVAEHPKVRRIRADWNLDARLEWVRAYFARHFPDFEIVAPTTATHRGGRVIDWALVRKGHGDWSAETAPNPASDHEAVVFTRQEAPVSRHPKTDAWVASMRRRGVEVLLHDDWGSVRRNVYLERLTSRPHALLPGRPSDTLWNHISVTFDDGVLVGDFEADMRELERIGYDRFGSGVSYNVAFDRNAPHPRCALGQFFEAKGTHTVNDKGTPGYSRDQNAVGIAFAWVGMPGDRLNEHALEAMVQGRAAAIEVGILTGHYDDVSHSLVAAKDCPTDELRDRLPDLKRRALAAATAPERPAPHPPDREDWFTMATQEDLRAEVEGVWNRNRLVDAPRHWPEDNPGTSPARALAATWQNSVDARADARAALAGVQAIAKALDALAPGIAEQVTVAVEKALAEGIELTVTAGGEQA